MARTSYRSVPNRRAVASLDALVTPEPEPDYASLKKDALVIEATRRGVDASGTKAEILARLQK